MLLTVLVSLLLPFAAAVDENRQPRPTPLMRTVDPYMAKAGMEVTVTGDHLGKHLVAEVSLTAGKASYKVEILSQTDTELKFKVPADVKPGGYRLTVLLTSAEPTLIEEPVRIVIEE